MLCYDQSKEKGSLGVFIYNWQQRLKITLIEPTGSMSPYLQSFKSASGQKQVENIPMY